MSYIGTEPKDIRSFGRTKFDYTATQGQTAFTGADDDGKVLAFTVGQIEVYVNGILMDDSDFTTTGTGTVTLASAANLNDVVNVVSFETNIPDSNYVPASGGTFTGNITASNGLTVDDAGATPLIVDRATNDGTIIDAQRDGTSVGSIKTDSGKLVVNSQGSNLVFAVGGTSKANMDGTQFYPQTDGGLNLSHPSVRWQDLYLSGGAYLGGTGAANKLDDYEEGTWTPGIDATSGTSPTVSFPTSQPSGNYTKIGRQVHVSFYLPDFIVSGTVSGNIAITGLPFSYGSIPSSGGVISAYYITWARPNFVATKVISGNQIGFLSQNNGGGWGWEILSAITGGGKYLEGAVTYFTT